MFFDPNVPRFVPSTASDRHPSLYAGFRMLLGPGGFSGYLSRPLNVANKGLEGTKCGSGDTRIILPSP